MQDCNRVSEILMLRGDGRLVRSTIEVESPVAFKDLSLQGQVALQSFVVRAAMEDLQARGLSVTPSECLGLMQRVAGMFADDPELQMAKG